MPARLAPGVLNGDELTGPLINPILSRNPAIKGFLSRYAEKYGGDFYAFGRKRAVVSGPQGLTRQAF